MVGKIQVDTVDTPLCYSRTCSQTHTVLRNTTMQEQLELSKRCHLSQGRGWCRRTLAAVSSLWWVGGWLEDQEVFVVLRLTLVSNYSIKCHD